VGLQPQSRQWSLPAGETAVPYLDSVARLLSSIKAIPRAFHGDEGGAAGILPTVCKSRQRALYGPGQICDQNGVSCRARDVVEVECAMSLGGGDALYFLRAPSLEYASRIRTMMFEYSGGASLPGRPRRRLRDLQSISAIPWHLPGVEHPRNQFQKRFVSFTFIVIRSDKNKLDSRAPIVSHVALSSFFNALARSIGRVERADAREELFVTPQSAHKAMIKAEFDEIRELARFLADLRKHLRGNSVWQGTTTVIGMPVRAKDEAGTMLEIRGWGLETEVTEAEPMRFDVSIAAGDVDLNAVAATLRAMVWDKALARLVAIHTSIGGCEVLGSWEVSNPRYFLSKVTTDLRMINGVVAVTVHPAIADWRNDVDSGADL
jgi:hypothetical protein